MVAAKTTKSEEAYFKVVADQIEQIASEAEDRGIGAAANAISDLVARLAATDSTIQLFGVLTPLWSLIASMLASLLDEIVMHDGACRVVEATELDDAAKKSLELCFRSTSLASVNGKRGHMIEAKALLEVIPSLGEFGLDQQQAIVRGLREAHQTALRKELPAEESAFFAALVKALRTCELVQIESVLLKEVSRLHERIVESRK